MRLSRLLPALLTTGLSLAFFACQDPTTGTSDEHETSMARLYRTDGTPAARAKMKFYSVSDTAQVPAALTYTTENGEIQLPELPAGLYNAVASDGAGSAALIDSIVFSANGKASVLSDTLKPMGVLRGRVVVQPQHSPRIAWIQVMGMGVAANVDSLGRFEISLPAGRATIYALTREAHYTPTFQVVTAGTGVTQDLGVIRLIYTGIPVVAGLEVQYDSLSGVATVRWNRPQSRGIQGYRLEIGGDYVQRSVVVLESGLDTVFMEPVFSPTEKLPTPANEPMLINMARERNRRYSIRAVDSAGDTGAAWQKGVLTAKSPLLTPKLKVVNVPLADRPAGCWEVDTLASGLICIGYQASQKDPTTYDFQDRVGLDSIQVWTNGDGQKWSNRLPIPGAAFNAVAWRGLIWVARGWWSRESSLVQKDGAFIKAGVLLGAVVEAWNPSGSLVRRDTIADVGKVHWHRLQVSGDSLLLSTDTLDSLKGSRNNMQGFNWFLPGEKQVWQRDSIHRSLRGEMYDITPASEHFQFMQTTGLSDFKGPDRTDWLGLGITRYGYRWFAWKKGQLMPWMLAVDSYNAPILKYRGKPISEPSLTVWNDCALLPGENQSLSMLCPER